MDTHEPSTRAGTAAPLDLVSAPLDLVRGLVVAFPLSLVLWMAVARVVGGP
jgi:hypothetical protein